jgi:uncharacterized membrane protein
MTVHFPIAFALCVPLFNLLYMITGNPCVESAAFYMLVLTALAAPVAMITGPYTWWLNYGARWSFNIKAKMGTSALMFVLILAALLWRISDPAILFTPHGSRTVYLVLSFILPVLVTVLGWFGAKMTFPH